MTFTTDLLLSNNLLIEFCHVLKNQIVNYTECGNRSVKINIYMYSSDGKFE